MVSVLSDILRSLVCSGEREKIEVTWNYLNINQLGKVRVRI
jgi:hypothetical protein